MLPPDQYLTITRPGQGEYHEKGSRFMAFSEAVLSAEEADQRREELKKQYYDAAHQPFAYRLIDGTERSSDDGEPHGTSGPTILKLIQAAELYNVQVVVVRYFGGTKLGKGGLARAFSEAAGAALADAKIIERFNTRLLALEVAPEDVNTVKGIIGQYSGEIAAIAYAEQAHLDIALPVSTYEACREALQNRLDNRLTVRTA